MTDKELLELAAKAAGYSVRWNWRWECFEHTGPHNIDNPPTLAGQRHVWVPLHDDGDAFRLISLLWLSVDWHSDSVEIIGGQGDVQEAFNRADPSSKSAALRRAIVRAAAEIGKAMP